MGNRLLFFLGRARVFKAGDDDAYDETRRCLATASGR